MLVVFLGPPGCGKGTQAEFLKNEYNYNIISTGDILRENKNKVIDRKTGDTIGDIISRGMLLPDSVTIDVVSEEVSNLKNNKNNIIFDGFPRTVWQTGALEVIARPEIVFNFIIDEKILIKRITGRFQCVNCGRIYNKFLKKSSIDGICDICKGTEFKTRSDDNEETLQTRLSEYHEKTLPIIEFYTRNGRLVNIEASISVNEVIGKIVKILIEKEKS